MGSKKNNIFNNYYLDHIIIYIHKQKKKEII